MLIAIGPAAILLLPAALVAGGFWIFRKKKTGTTDPGKVPGGGRVIPPPPPKPFFLTPVSGGVVLQISSVFELYKWATTTAVENGATSDSEATDVLMSLASSLNDSDRARPLLGIVLNELPKPNDDEWSDVLAGATGRSWGEVLELAEAWMQEKGLA